MTKYDPRVYARPKALTRPKIFNVSSLLLIRTHKPHIKSKRSQFSISLLLFICAYKPCKKSKVIDCVWETEKECQRGVGDEAGDGSLHFIPCHHLVCYAKKNKLAMMKGRPN
jgi:hypothetical protein